MKFFGLLFFLPLSIAILSMPLIAESKAKKERGGSCTESCTVNADINVQEFKTAAEAYNLKCSLDKAGEPGNLNWCSQNCTKEGGLYTKLFNRKRKENVESFIKSRTIACSTLSQKLPKKAGFVDCPKNNSDTKVVYLKSSGGVCVKLRTEVAKQSKTLSDLFKDIKDYTKSPIPLSSVGNDALLDIAALLSKVFDNKEKVTQLVSDQLTIGRLETAKYLDIPLIFDAAMAEFSRQIFGKSIDDLNIRNPGDYKAYKEKFLIRFPKALQLELVRRYNDAPRIPIARLSQDFRDSCVAFSPDGTRILTGSNDGTAKLWDAKVQGKY